MMILATELAPAYFTPEQARAVLERALRLAASPLPGYAPLHGALFALAQAIDDVEFQKARRAEAVTRVVARPPLPPPAEAAIEEPDEDAFAESEVCPATTPTRE